MHPHVAASKRLPAAASALLMRRSTNNPNPSCDTPCLHAVEPHKMVQLGVLDDGEEHDEEDDERRKLAAKVDLGQRACSEREGVVGRGGLE